MNGDFVLHGDCFVDGGLGSCLLRWGGLSYLAQAGLQRVFLRITLNLELLLLFPLPRHPVLCNDGDGPQGTMHAGKAPTSAPGF